MGKNSKYFLSIGDTIVDFSSSEEFKGLHMDSFQNISLFTTLFDSELELIKALEKLGIELSEEESYDKIEIVKRTGTKKEGYEYTFASDDILYKSGINKLSTRAISNFLISTRDRYDVISELLDTYAADLKRLEIIFNYKINTLTDELDDSLDEGTLPTLGEQLTSKKRSLKNIRHEQKIIEKIREQIEKLRNREQSYQRDEDLKYMQLLSMFVKAETLYKNDNKMCTNAKGLFRFAARVDNILRGHPDLEFDGTTSAYIKERQVLLRALKNALQNENQLSSVYYELTEYEEQQVEASQTTPGKKESTEEDPDDFMLLENDDYERLFERSDTDRAKENLEAALLELEDKKGKHL